MLWYVNWKLTRAQVELIAADVSVVDYNYGRNKKRSGKKGEFDDRKANASDVEKARKEWLERYGTPVSGDSGNSGGGISMASVFDGVVTR